MQGGASLQFGIQNLRNKEHQVLADEAEATAVSSSVLDVEVLERFLPHDGQIGEPEDFLKRREHRLAQVAVIHVDLKHLQKERCQLAIHLFEAVLEITGRKIFRE